MELLIHVGMDTVEMNGEGFEKFVEQGQKVTKGQKLVAFDIEKIKNAGHDTTVSVIISNTDNFANVTGVPAAEAALDTDVIYIQK